MIIRSVEHEKDVTRQPLCIAPTRRLFLAHSKGLSLCSCVTSKRLDTQHMGSAHLDSQQGIIASESNHIAGLPSFRLLLVAIEARRPLTESGRKRVGSYLYVAQCLEREPRYDFESKGFSSQHRWRLPLN